jgi:hypothetical protein
VGIKTKKMKATNIFKSLKDKGVCSTDGAPVTPIKFIEEVNTNPKRAARIARRRAKRGHRAGIRFSNACGRSTRGKGSTYGN